MPNSLTFLFWSFSVPVTDVLESLPLRCHVSEKVMGKRSSFHSLSKVQSLHLIHWFEPWDIWTLFGILLLFLMFNPPILKCKRDPNWKRLTTNYIILTLFQLKLNYCFHHFFFRTIRVSELFLVTLILNSTFKHRKMAILWKWEQFFLNSLIILVRNAKVWDNKLE